MAKPIFSNEITVKVRHRALNCCEYCKSQDKYSPHFFTIDHIIPLNLNGTDEIDNLAYACFLCNRLKSNKLKIFDQITEKWVAIFNPRIHNWNDHFVWNEDTTQIIGITAIGRSTVSILKLERFVKVLQEAAENDEWWQDIPKEEQARILKSYKESYNSENWIDHEDVKKQHAKWLQK